MAICHHPSLRCFGHAHQHAFHSHRFRYLDISDPCQYQKKNVGKNVPWEDFFFFFLLGCFGFGCEDVVGGDSASPFDASSVEVEESEMCGRRLPRLLGPGSE